MKKKTTITRIDYTAARERLASITAGPAALAGLDCIRARGELYDALRRARRARIGLRKCP